jgi:hypothetical protein
MTQQAVERLLGPTRLGMTKLDHVGAIADYPARGVTVYYDRERKVYNVRGRTLEQGHLLARAGERRTAVEARLGAPDSQPPGCFCDGCRPESRVYADRELEVYLRHPGNNWETATVTWFELGSRVNPDR